MFLKYSTVSISKILLHPLLVYSWIEHITCFTNIIHNLGSPNQHSTSYVLFEFVMSIDLWMNTKHAVFGYLTKMSIIKSVKYKNISKYDVLNDYSVDI